VAIYGCCNLRLISIRRFFSVSLFSSVLLIRLISAAAYQNKKAKGGITMKVKFKYGIKTYTGTVDNMTYGSYRSGNICIGRVYVYPTLTENNHNKGLAAKNLASVFHNASEGYIDDLKLYAMRNGQENVPKTSLIPSAFALFLKMMYAYYASDPTHVDLTTITVEDIVSADADVRTIARAVEADFLPYISVYEDLTNGIA
jgi:hypothetical protein